MQIFKLGNGHTLEVDKANRGLDDDYIVIFKEDGKALFGAEYCNKEYLEYEYGIEVK